MLLFNHVKMEDCCVCIYRMWKKMNLFISFHNLLNKRTNLVWLDTFRCYSIICSEMFCKRSLIFPSQLGKIYFILCTILFFSLCSFSLIDHILCFFIFLKFNQLHSFYSLQKIKQKKEFMFSYKRKLKVDCSEN